MKTTEVLMVKRSYSLFTWSLRKNGELIQEKQGATLGEVAEVIDSFCIKADMASTAIEELQSTGQLKLIDKY